MCKVYSKELKIMEEEYSEKPFSYNSKKKMIIKNTNHNTCSGTAFIKP